jgi:Tfp pilus assembly protein PilW
MVKHSKSGFFLIELMIGLSISTFFMLLITHYIIEVKVTQQKALKRAEQFSLTRNEKERNLAKQYGNMYA